MARAATIGLGVSIFGSTGGFIASTLLIGLVIAVDAFLSACMYPRVVSTLLWPRTSIRTLTLVPAS